MTILFAGGEEIDFVITGTATTTTTASTFRSSFSRCAMIVNGVASDPPSNRLGTPSFAAQSTLWVHGQWSNNGFNTSTSACQLLRVLDGGVARILVRGTGTAGQLKISTRNAAGTIVDLVTSASGAYIAQVAPHQLDLFINYAVAGQVTLYLDGVIVATFSGDVTTNSATTLNSVEFSSPTTGGNICLWSECIVEDGDTRGKSLLTLAPAAAGNTQSWTPNTVGNINEIGLSDATFVSTTANNALSEWTTPLTIPAGTWSVDAIVQSARAQVGATGPQHFDWLVRTGGADFTGGVSNAPTTSFGNFSNFIWATNPNTGTAWQTSDIAAGFNLGIKSLA